MRSIILTRSACFYVYGFFWTLILALPIPILYLLKNDGYVRTFSRIYSNGIIFGLRYVVDIDHREIGAHNKVDGPAIYVCNHQSAWETLVFNVLVREVAIVLKESLYFFPIIGWYLRHSPMVAIDRSGGARSMMLLIRRCREIKSGGRPILIFPEGTRMPLYCTRNYHVGVAMLYKSLDLPVVPVAVNAGVFWPRESLTKNPGTITVSYLPAIEPGLKPMEFMARIQSTIGNEKDRLSRNPDV